MVIDNLVGATIVLADGSVKQLPNKTNEDLFWAIRGGGPNFGVVTDFTFKAHPQPNKVVAGIVVFPVEKLQEVVEATNNWLNNRQPDEDVTLIISKAPSAFNVIKLYLINFFFFCRL
jgi:FAD/FMN-containing dehydrogenase